jgi:hypothetical protein
MEIFGVPEEYCLNVLGMAESASNYVDSSLRDMIEGIYRPRHKPNLKWARVVAMDLESCTKILPQGTIGLLRHYDLANLPTVLSVQTDNLGYCTESGFEIIGRAQVINGQVSLQPSEKPVGPMGDRKIFKFLDMYMKFSINRQMAGIKKDEPFCPCGETIEGMIERNHQ